jgi:hypothetical protein
MPRLVSPRRRACLFSSLAVLLTLALGGCGSRNTGSISGTVSYKGQPLGNGSVVFVGKEGKGDSSPIGADGSYQVNRAPVGQVKITVETVPPAPTAGAIPMAGKITPSGGPEMPKSPGAAGKYVKIPDKYKDAAQSTLTYEVKPGSQKYDINLD